jgi:hypothetical protein
VGIKKLALAKGSRKAVENPMLQEVCQTRGREKSSKKTDFVLQGIQLACNNLQDHLIREEATASNNPFCFQAHFCPFRNVLAQQITSGQGENVVFGSQTRGKRALPRSRFSEHEHAEYTFIALILGSAVGV